MPFIWAKNPFYGHIAGLMRGNPQKNATLQKSVLQIGLIFGNGVFYGDMISRGFVSVPVGSLRGYADK
jgi:hypothetical protein